MQPVTRSLLVAGVSAAEGRTGYLSPHSDLVALLVLYPLVLPGYLDLGTRMLVMVLFAMSLDLLVGYCGRQEGGPRGRRCARGEDPVGDRAPHAGDRRLLTVDVPSHRCPVPPMQAIPALPLKSYTVDGSESGPVKGGAWTRNSSPKIGRVVGMGTTRPIPGPPASARSGEPKTAPAAVAPAAL